MADQPHPDHGWLGRVRRALDAWEAAPSAQPTSSVLGGGAVAVAEAAFSALHENRSSLLLPSATYAMRVGLQVLGVRPGHEVLCAAIDWNSGFAAITSLGAIPVGVPADPLTLTIDPAGAAAARTSRTSAVIACHLHGICADVPALRARLPGIPVLEDAAQAFGCALDGLPAGCLGDAAVLSLGPGKQLDAGEGGVLICCDEARHKAATRLACHPLRNIVKGISKMDPSALSIRPHPLTAILALHALAEWSPASAKEARDAVRDLLMAVPGTRVLGGDARRTSTCRYVPVILDTPNQEPPPGVFWSPSGAVILPCGSSQLAGESAELIARVRLATEIGLT